MLGHTTDQRVTVSLFADVSPLVDDLVANVVLVDTADVGDCFAADPPRGNYLNIVEPDIRVVTVFFLASTRILATFAGPAL